MELDKLRNKIKNKYNIIYFVTCFDDKFQII